MIYANPNMPAWSSSRGMISAQRKTRQLHRVSKRNNCNTKLRLDTAPTHLHRRREESVLLLQPVQDLALVDVDIAKADVREPVGL